VCPFKVVLGGGPVFPQQEAGLVWVMVERILSDLCSTVMEGGGVMC
jgi:hypothetical protein